MAGSPLKNKVITALKARAVAQFGEDATILDFGAEWIASGRSIAELAREVAAEIGASVSRPLMSAVLNNSAPDAQEVLTAARKEASHALVEAAMEIADDAEETTAGVQKARLQVGMRQWFAERLDATSYGAKGGANVTINIGALMLDALRQPPPPRPQFSPDVPQAALGAGAAEYEILESGEPV